MTKAKLVAAAFSVCSGLVHCVAQPPPREPEWFVRAVEQTFSAERSYAYDATVEFARKIPERAAEVTARFRVQWAAAPGGRRALQVSTDKGFQYVIVSDGSRTWARVPSLNRYMGVEGSWAAGLDPDRVFAHGPDAPESESMLAAELVIPVLARISNRPSLIEMNKVAEVEGGDEPLQYPVLTVLSEPTTAEGQTMTEVAIDPETLRIARLEWTSAVTVGDEKVAAHLKAMFNRIRIGNDVPPETFTFRPENSELARELPLPGLGGSLLVNMSAPDFEIRGIGAVGRLSSLRGRTALLAFTAGNEEPSVRQIAAIAPLVAEQKGKLAVVAIGAGRESTAYAATAVDPTRSLQRQYGVTVAPTIVIVDAEGKIAAFLPGVQDTATLRKALTGAGL